MKKFEYYPDEDYLKIDPLHLSNGLNEAQKKKYSSIRITALDYRIKNLAFNMKDLSDHAWIRKLIIDPGIEVKKEDAALIEGLVNLDELTINEYVPLDFSKFTHLKGLVLSHGNSLTGLDEVASLKSLYLSKWKAEELPQNISRISATDIRISASLKLASIEALFGNPHLASLMLQHLPKLSVGKNVNNLKSLKELSVEKCGWTDFSELESAILEDFFASEVQSLDFIKQLKTLRKLAFWNCVDGNMTPIMEHPTLKEVYFTPQKKHYSHKEKFLQEYIQGKHSNK